ncbi:MAG: hypothetical protein PWR13_1081 [Archaeoglobi archaeon]|nr:hypothetical protein [Archaeoglobi archaeon]
MSSYVKPVPKSFSLSEVYVKKIRWIQARLGLPSESEVIRRAIDEYVEKLGLRE